MIFVFLFITLFTILEIIKYRAESIPENIPYTKINDIKIDGTLEFYYDEHHNRYWLLYKKDNSEKLILHSVDSNGIVSVKVVDDNKIGIYYDYLDDLEFPIEDEHFIIDLTKNETHNISFLRKLMQ